MKVSDIKKLSNNDISAALVDYRKQLFSLRMKQAMQPSEAKTHEFKVIKRTIARLKTILSTRSNNG